jgi:hypothetical protein
MLVLPVIKPGAFTIMKAGPFGFCPTEAARDAPKPQRRHLHRVAGGARPERGSLIARHRLSSTDAGDQTGVLSVATDWSHHAFTWPDGGHHRLIGSPPSPARRGHRANGAMAGTTLPAFLDTRHPKELRQCSFALTGKAWRARAARSPP